MARTGARLVLALPTMPRIPLQRNPIRKYFWRGRWDLEDLKGKPWWRVWCATEERKGTALEEGMEEFYDSRKEQRRHPAELPSRHPRRCDAIRPATLPEKRGSHRKYFRRRRRDLEELKGGPWWRVRCATEERKGAALEEGTEEFYDSRKEQRRRPAERPSRHPRRRDAI
ncbi:hypothetical protein NDU88_006273 [Pleurodeles waltl]|uniref:Uncharacterized protein n=1 Tax=Pleurodeles waltl TaxID=8319 RepID=A0AAV7PQW7_PLEWA|nr:hypothetical protein NDU88_006273 [Pleurodeles waltl]